MVGSIKREVKTYVIIQATLFIDLPPAFITEETYIETMTKAYFHEKHGHNFRFYECYLLMKEAIQGGCLGMDRRVIVVDLMVLLVNHL